MAKVILFLKCTLMHEQQNRSVRIKIKCTQTVLAGVAGYKPRNNILNISPFSYIGKSEEGRKRSPKFGFFLNLRNLSLNRVFRTKFLIPAQSSQLDGRKDTTSLSFLWSYPAAFPSLVPGLLFWFVINRSLCFNVTVFMCT